MRRSGWIAALLALGLLAIQVQAAIRINGNQLFEGAGRYTFADARRHRGARAGAAAPPIRRLWFNIGQTVQGRGDLPGAASGDGAIAFAIGVGLMYDVNNVALENNCRVVITGDANNTGAINSADIIHMVNFVFKGGPDPIPCQGAGDVNCSGDENSSDLIYLVNFVFKSGPEPCDVCYLMPQVWSCP